MTNVISPSDDPVAAAHNTPPSTRFVFVGFHATVDRNSVNKLLAFASAVAAKRPAPKALILCITSEGGSMEAAFYAYEVLRALPIGLGTHNLGVVASSANILFMAGNKRFAAPNTGFLLHRTKFPFPGPGTISQGELDVVSKNIKSSDDRLVALMAERIDKPKAKVGRWFQEKMRTAEFALEQGIIHEICPLAVGHEDEFVQIVF